MNETNNQLEETGSGTGKFDIYIYIVVWQRNYDCRARDLVLHFPVQTERNVAQFLRPICSIVGGKSVPRFKERSLSLP